MLSNINPILKVRILNNRFPKETKNLVFTPWTLEDKEALFSLAQDKEVGLNSGWTPHKTVYESLKVIEDTYINIYTYALRLKNSNELIGYISLLPGNLSMLKVGKTEAEIGFWIGKKYWNKGYASEAIESLLDYAFNTIRYRGVWGGCLDNNEKSEHLFKKNNFHYWKTIPVQYLNDSRTYKREKVFYLFRTKYLNKNG